jgi:hypothetical protein
MARRSTGSNVWAASSGSDICLTRRREGEYLERRGMYNRLVLEHTESG